MLIEEFIPLCERATTWAAADRAAPPWAGRWAAMACCWRPRPTAGLRRRGRHSPAVWPSYAAMMKAHATPSTAPPTSPPTTYRSRRLLAGTPLLVECGTVDPFYPYVRDLCAVLPAGAHYRSPPAATTTGTGARSNRLRWSSSRVVSEPVLECAQGCSQLRMGRRRATVRQAPARGPRARRTASVARTADHTWGKRWTTKHRL